MFVGPRLKLNPEKSCDLCKTMPFQICFRMLQYLLLLLYLTVPPGAVWCMAVPPADISILISYKICCISSSFMDFAIFWLYNTHLLLVSNADMVGATEQKIFAGSHFSFGNSFLCFHTSAGSSDILPIVLEEA